MKSQSLSLIITFCALIIIVLNWPKHRATPYADFHETVQTAALSQSPVSPPNISTETPPQDNLHDVRNETLGFQEVHVISLPQRGDKQDSFAMQAAYSGIKYKLVDGVDGRVVPDKALPPTMDQDNPTIGCWRAHLNVYQGQYFQTRIKSNLSPCLFL
jgi:hypothetical protein